MCAFRTFALMMGGPAVAALLVGCTGAAPIPSAVTAKVDRGSLGRLRHDLPKKAGLVYVSLYNQPTGNIQIYLKDQPNPSPIGAITDLDAPRGVAANGAGDIYVANQAWNIELVFPRASLWSNKALYDLPNGEANGDCLAASGKVYVANTTIAGGPGNVEVFARGSLTPTSSLNDSSASQMIACAVNAHGTTYVLYRNVYGAVEVDAFHPHSKVPKSLGIVFLNAYGVAVDANDNLYVSGEMSSNPSSGGVYVYPPNSNQPKAEFDSGGVPAGIALDDVEHRLYVCDLASSSGDVFVYDVTTQKLVNTISAGLAGPYSVAVTASK
jgi:DNA-binding beta-propeller fold protein YncE